jgi:hypothetical protein
MRVSLSRFLSKKSNTGKLGCVAKISRAEGRECGSG